MKRIILTRLTLLFVLLAPVSVLFVPQPAGADHLKVCRYANGVQVPANVGETCPTIIDDDGNGVDYVGESVVQPDVDHSEEEEEGGGDGEGGEGEVEPRCITDFVTTTCLLEPRADCETDGEALTSENCKIIAYLVIGINIMTGLAGMAIVFSVVWAGFEYMTAQDNPGQVAAARNRIYWAMLAALPMLIFSVVLLDLLVPGGVL